MDLTRWKETLIEDHRTRPGVVASRLPAAALGRLPTFAVIGAQKSGTTALFSMLTKHPDIRPPIVKEVRFFDRWPDRPLRWYRAYFPVPLPHSSYITGEATPEYIFFPHVAPAMAAALPDIRLIAVIRDPVSRTHSQYHMNIAKDREWLSFDDALRAEDDRISAGPGQPRSPESQRWSHFGYRRRSHYSEQLARWLEWFPREQLLVLTTDELANAQNATLQKVTDFLGLPAMELLEPTRKNERSYIPMSDFARDLLEAEFADEAAAVSKVIGREIRWPTPNAATP